MKRKEEVFCVLIVLTFWEMELRSYLLVEMME